MGNIKGWAGPLSLDFMKAQSLLQQQILAQMRAFGMTPVLPGFAGHVPDALLRVFPNANVTRSASWGNFNSSFTGVLLLEPTDPLFAELGRAFVNTQTALYGTDHFYNADTFNEMEPRTNDPAYLAACGAAVYSSMSAADPQAVWVMQGWLFYNQGSFWQPPQVRALLSAVPDDAMLM
jgi:alpha-N-acetylglucosaminidase